MLKVCLGPISFWCLRFGNTLLTCFFPPPFFTVLCVLPLVSLSSVINIAHFFSGGSLGLVLKSCLSPFPARDQVLLPTCCYCLPSGLSPSSLVSPSYSSVQISHLDTHVSISLPTLFPCLPPHSGAFSGEDPAFLLLLGFILQLYIDVCAQRLTHNGVCCHAVCNSKVGDKLSINGALLK